MNKFLKTILYPLVGIIIFVGGGFFFAQFHHVKNIAQNPNEVKVLGEGEALIQLKKELFIPPLLKSLDLKNDTAFNGDYGLLDSGGIINLTNEERIKAGFLPLYENKKLDSSAEMKVDDIFAKQYFQHESPEGISVADLVKENGYDYILIGENLALGNFKNNNDLIDSWMASPGHKANILKKQYTEIGVSAKIGNFQGKEVWVAVEHFGLSSEVCPEVGSELQNEITKEKSALQVKSDSLALQKAYLGANNSQNDPKYQEKVNEYNEAISSYNQVISDLKTKITEYNKEAKLFNDCVTEFKPELQTQNTF